MKDGISQMNELNAFFFKSISKIFSRILVFCWNYYKRLSNQKSNENLKLLKCHYQIRLTSTLFFGMQNNDTFNNIFAYQNTFVSKNGHCNPSKWSCISRSSSKWVFIRLNFRHASKDRCSIKVLVSVRFTR